MRKSLREESKFQIHVARVSGQILKDRRKTVSRFEETLKIGAQSFYIIIFIREEIRIINIHYFIK